MNTESVRLPVLHIVVLNFRTPALTIDCLRSLVPEVETVPGTRVTVVENGSGDDSAHSIAGAIEQNGWSGWATLRVSVKNWGFAGGNNRGIELWPEARHVLLLNSDTIVHRGCLRHCYDVMETDLRIGALSCRLLNHDGSNQNVARRFPTPARLMCKALGLPFRLPAVFGWADTEDPGWDRATTARDVDWIGGAFLWTRGAILRQLGGLDEAFFFEGEDVEFCHRLWRRGWRVRYDPRATITHLGGASSDPSRMQVTERTLHRWRARYVVVEKCHGRSAARAMRAFDIATNWCRAMGLRLRGRAHEPRYQELIEAARLLAARREVLP